MRAPEAGTYELWDLETMGCGGLLPEVLFQGMRSLARVNPLDAVGGRVVVRFGRRASSRWLFAPTTPIPALGLVADLRRAPATAG